MKRFKWLPVAPVVHNIHTHRGRSIKAGLAAAVVISSWRPQRARPEREMTTTTTISPAAAAAASFAAASGLACHVGLRGSRAGHTEGAPN